MPVYRTYRARDMITDQDKRILLEAIQTARGSSPGTDASAFDFLAELMTKPALNEAEGGFCREVAAAHARGNG